MKITKLEIAVVATLFLALIVSYAVLINGLTKAADQINKQGLKSITEQIWNGTNQVNTNSYLAGQNVIFYTNPNGLIVIEATNQCWRTNDFLYKNSVTNNL